MSARPPRLAAALVLAALAAPARAPAEDRPAPVTVDWTVDGAVTGGALALWLGSELLKDRLAPSTCRWCGRNGLDTGARDAVVWADRAAAGRASDVLLVAVPLGVALYDAVAAGTARDAAPDLLLLGEAVAIAGVLTQGAKLVAARTRPYATYGTLPSEGKDDHASFFSGHTSLAFSAAAAGGTLARLRGDRAWPWVYAAGFGAAAATGWLRMAGDRHWLTDVLAGAATGTAVGLAVPWLHRTRASPSPARLSIAPGGLVLAAEF